MWLVIVYKESSQSNCQFRSEWISLINEKNQNIFEVPYQPYNKKIMLYNVHIYFKEIPYNLWLYKIKIHMSYMH